MPRSFFTHHFERHSILTLCLVSAMSVCGGAVVAAETMGIDMAKTFLFFGAAWLLLSTAGMLILQSFAARHAFAYALFSALAGNMAGSTMAVALFTPIFLLPSIGSLTGLILLEYFLVALGYQLWSTWRHFNEQWCTHHEAALGRCFDRSRSTVAVNSLARFLHLHETLFLQRWHENLVAIVSVALFIALLLGFALYDSHFGFALPAGGVASLSIITYFIQRTLIPVLLTQKLRQLERSHGCPIGLMDDDGIDRIRAADRRAKRGNKR